MTGKISKQIVAEHDMTGDSIEMTKKNCNRNLDLLEIFQQPPYIGKQGMFTEKLENTGGDRGCHIEATKLATYISRGTQNVNALHVPRVNPS